MLMESVITIFGRQIPLYGIFFYLGIFLSASAVFFLNRRTRLDGFDIASSGIYVMIGGVVGAKLLFLAVTAPTIIQEHIPLLAVIKGGFVFYGGLLGGAVGLLIYGKQYKMDMSKFADLYATVLPLGHAFGRVGCFFAGCCYGIPWRYGHVYHSTAGTTPLGVPLLPIQLIEAGALLVLFAVQLFLYLKNGKRYQNTLVYFCVYPMIRFVLEFFRGDVERGVLLGLSTSQWASLAIIAVLGVILCKARRRVASPTVGNK